MTLTPLPCGERAVRCLLGEPVDRVPFGVGVGWKLWGETLSRWRAATNRPDLDVAAEFEFDPSFALPEIHSGIYPPFKHTIIKLTKDFVITRDWRGIVMRNRLDHGSMPEFLEYPVKGWADWERLKAERLRVGDPGRITQDWDAFRARLKETGEAVQVGDFPFGVFGTPRDLLGAEELLVSFHTQPELIRDMMEHLTSLWISLWEQVADEVPIDHIHIWEDMSGRQGSLISPQMVDDFMMPCYARITDFARSIGARIISVDTDGDCHELVPLMMANGVNVFFPFEVQAGNNILDYRRSYPTLGIMGGLDKRALAGSTEDVDREIERAQAMIAQGRYLPGFDHLIPPDAKWENFSYAAERLKYLCYQSTSTAFAG